MSRLDDFFKRQAKKGKEREEQAAARREAKGKTPKRKSKGGWGVGEATPDFWID